MASLSQRRSENVPGPFFVDESCIDCDACRWVAPATFDEKNDQSRVYRQPETEEERTRALMAVLACPTSSIGTSEKYDAERIFARFPEPISENVFYCGYHHKASFGAASYLIVRPQGNVLIDSPRFTQPLVKRLEELGGVRHLFLTHQDDVADHKKFAAHFGCERILHVDDLSAGTREVEIQLEGEEPWALDDEILLIPVPGHTKGSVCLLYKEKFLLTGDHLAWSPDREQLVAFRGACWYDWRTQARSMKRLLDYPFEWVLPGHGRRCHFPAGRMREELRRCIEWMDAV